MDDNKSKALAAALSQIEKQFGKGSIMRLGEHDVARDIQVVSTGSLGLDIALGVGGLPRGRVVEIYGPESSGKTTLALQIVAEAQRAGGVAAGARVICTAAAALKGFFRGTDEVCRTGGDEFVVLMLVQLQLAPAARPGVRFKSIAAVREEALVPILAEQHGLPAAPIGRLPAPAARVLRLVPAELAEPRVFDHFDHVMLDDGERPRRRAHLAAGHAQHFLGELGVDLEVRRGVPFDVDRIDRVADVEELDLRAAVDQQRVGIVLDDLVGLLGVQMFHRGSRIVRREDYECRPRAVLRQSSHVRIARGNMAGRPSAIAYH